MIRITVVTGILLIVLGIGGYALTGGASITALIPSAVGVVFLVLAGIGSRERFRPHAMHGASVLALVGLIGSAGGIPQTFTLLAGGEAARPGAAIARTLMSFLCGVYIVLALRSCLRARRSGHQEQRQEE